MFDPHDTYQIALSVLNGEKDAHKILADMFEEQGDHANAAFARSDKKKPRKRFELVIGIVPICVSVHLACDFVEHALSEAYRSSGNLSTPRLDNVRSWCCDEMTSEQLLEVCTFLTPADTESGLQRRLRPPANSIDGFPQEKAFFDCVNLALRFFHKQPHPTRAVRSPGVNQMTKTLANLGRKEAAYTRAGGWEDPYHWQQELDWQMSQTKNVLEQYMAS